MTRIVCLSDTHLRQPEVPDGDILIHAGDLTLRGTFAEIARAGAWLDTLPHRHKIVIAGNHDFLFERDRAQGRHALGSGVIYLQDEEVTIEGLRIYGSPWQPRFYDWAFNLDRGPAIKRMWDRIPEGIDVLVTHGPPHGILDGLERGERVGCEELLKAVERVRPRLHVFGHIHSARGRDFRGTTEFVNAAICDESNRLFAAPVVVDL